MPTIDPPSVHAGTIRTINNGAPTTRESQALPKRCEAVVVQQPFGIGHRRFVSLLHITDSGLHDASSAMVDSWSKGVSEKSCSNGVSSTSAISEARVPGWGLYSPRSRAQHRTGQSDHTK